MAAGVQAPFIFSGLVFLCQLPLLLSALQPLTVTAEKEHIVVKRADNLPKVVLGTHGNRTVSVAVNLWKTKVILGLIIGEQGFPAG